ncbi:apolipoprotein N-acyltransferase [Gallaecimonas xiamenensis]|uniref:Apolipoprotein N-acyltransferase n=1 Tax=Gallaecimonas xiamenensis 3-C-1 TaxID=745411 RepID=K2ICH4_9GAMM|nr:apolipoprotein N-acyltransferase [Gallaecimonas xiamenensis]EKE67616.1 apolipoprotein N-acyltransferase [Gallaecimonas xiamenensis 3-C-1]
MTLQRLKSPLAAWLLGALSHLAFAPYHLAFVLLLTLPLWLWQLQGKTARQGAWLGFSFGFGFFVTGVAWVHVSIVQFGGLPLLFSMAAMAALALYLALYPALVGYLLNRFFPLPGWPRYLVALPIFWLASEGLRGWVLTGFPWLNLGVSQLDTPFGNWLAIGSEALAGYLLVWCAGALALARYQKPWVLAALGLMGLSTLLPQHWVKATGQQLKVALVQGNIPQSLKWNPDSLAPTLQAYQDLSRPSLDADLVLWPEAAVPDLEPAEQPFLDRLNSLAAFRHTSLVTGIIDYHFGSDSYFNTVIVLDGDYYYGDSNRYNKHHLLPIGEFVPFGDLLRPIAPLFNLPMSDFQRGPAVQPNLKVAGHQAAMAICYEVAFSGQVRANVHKDTDLLMTVSNDAWFGDSIGPWQHLQIAQVRARELGRPMLRATNDGVTATVDALGHIQRQLPRFVPATLNDSIHLVRGQTPYGRFGLLWAWLLLPLLLLGWRFRLH